MYLPLKHKSKKKLNSLQSTTIKWIILIRVTNFLYYDRDVRERSFISYLEVKSRVTIKNKTKKNNLCEVEVWTEKNNICDSVLWGFMSRSKTNETPS